MSLNIKKVSPLGLLVALGIIFGDIGTSPLYVFNAIIGSKTVSEQLIIGSLSCSRQPGGRRYLLFICTCKKKKAVVSNCCHDRGCIIAR